MNSSLVFVRGFLLAGLVFCFCCSVYTFWNREKRGGTTLSLTFLGGALWVVADLIHVITPAQPVPQLGLHLRFLGADFIVIGVFLFGVQYTGRKHWITRQTLVMLALKPLVTQALVVSPFRQHLASVSTSEVLIVGYNFELTPLLMAHNLYSWTLLVSGLALLAHMMVKAEHGYRWQVVAVFLALAVPTGVNIVQHLSRVPFDPTSISYVVSSSLILFAVFRLRFMDAVPVARRAVLEQMDEMVFLLDEQGDIVTVNDAVRETFDTSTGLTGTPITDVLGDGVPARSDEATTERLSISIQRDGCTRYLTINRSLLTDYRENVLGQLLVCRDVTERTEYQRELEEKNERLNRFASVMSHDLRNPLNVARLRTDLAEQDGKAEHFDALRDAHERMETIIDDMLVLARTETTVDETEQVDLRPLVSDAWQTTQTDDADIEKQVPQDWRVDCNPDLTRNILENLYRNAVDHNSLPLTVRIGTLASDQQGFYVEDTGTGIPEDERTDIFDYGHTTSETGTGLGLAIVRDLVEAQGWEITVTEASNGGARFEIVTV